jgi:hypothetical protein
VAGIRQIVESVYDKLFNTFGLWQERPHELRGLRARLAARMALAGPASAEGCAQPDTPLETGSYHARAPQACDGIAIAAKHSTHNQ